MYTRVARRESSAQAEASVYTNLDELVRLQFQASGFSFLPRQPIHSLLSGRHASRLRGRGLNFEELRGYLPGDDIRNIDWKVTARTREPHVRVYTEERDRSVWLLIDQRRTMFFGSRVKMKAVAAAETAALSAWRVLKAGDRVGAIIFDDEQLEVIAPHRSNQNVHHLLARLCEFNHALDSGPAAPTSQDMLNQALEKLRPLAKHDCLVALISDGHGLDARSQRHITALTEHNDVLCVFIYDPMEQELTDGGRLVFSDGARQLDIDSSNRKLRRDYRASFEQRLERISSSSRKYDIPLLPIHTALPVAGQVKKLIGHKLDICRS